MKVWARTITAVAAATLIMPPPGLRAEEPTKSAANANRDGGSSSSRPAGEVLGSDPVTIPGAGQMSTGSAQYSGSQAITPKVEIFLGYSYLRAVPTLAAGNRFVWLNGGSASVAFNLNRYFGLVADVGGMDDSEIRLTGAGANPAGVVGSGGTAYTFLFGPRLSYRAHERFTPFAQVLAGGVRASQVTLSGCTGATCVPLPTQTAFAMTAGGGLDINLRRHLALRLVQAEYLMTRFPNTANGTSSTSGTQNDIRLSSGLVFRLGGGPPPPPVAYSCVASPASVYPGDPVTVTGTALNLNPKATPTYGWTATGGSISGATFTATINTNGAAPGSYMANGHVSEGNKPGHSADCSAAYTVMAFQPPTVSCSANPSTIRQGDAVTITAQGTSPQNRPLTYSYSASTGSISGATSTATLNTASATPGTITVTCNVVDDKGQTASSTATVSMQTPTPAPAPTTQKLCSISFERDTKRSTRVDNEAKACLDDVALNLQRSSDAKLALVGNGGSAEGQQQTRGAAQRAVNTKDYLVTEKGIDASRIAVYTGSSDSKTVDTSLIVPGATLDMQGLTAVDESLKPIARKGAAKKRSRK